jgi:hypothetical protein
MKLLSMVLVIGLFFSGLCFAQTQTGNASYNASKSGLTIAHSSMSFGAKVRVTNLRNNREVIATVDGRIPASDSRVADISRETGDAIGMSPTGYTEVRIEHIVPQQDASPAPASSPASQSQPAPQAPPLASTGETGTRAPPAAATPSPAGQEPRIETIQLVSPLQAPPSVQYVALPSQEGQNCFNSPLCVAILILLIIAVLLLVAILVLLLCVHRIPWWPWYYPVWLRRHIRYIKKRAY